MPNKRKPIRVHEFLGTPLHYNPDETSLAPSSRPPLPGDIRRAGLSKEFKAICTVLENKRSLTEGDGDLIRLLVIARHRHASNWELLRQEGEFIQVTVFDSNGQAHEKTKENPRSRLIDTTHRQIVDCITRLGLAAISRDKPKPTAGPLRGPDGIVPGSLRDQNRELLAKPVTEEDFQYGG